MALAGRHLSAGELAQELGDVPPATLYRHINRLAEGGLLEVVEERPVRNTIERVYTLKPGAAHAGQAEFSRLSPEEKLRYFVSYLLSLLDDYARYLNQPGVASQPGPEGYQKFPLYLTAHEFGEMVQELNQVILPRTANQPGDKRRPIIMGFFTIPVPDARPPNQERASDDRGPSRS